MIEFMHEIEAVHDIESLLKKKTKIKDLVVSPQLNWNSRMELYQKVQIINTRIAQLSSNSQSGI